MHACVRVRAGRKDIRTAFLVQMVILFRGLGIQRTAVSSQSCVRRQVQAGVRVGARHRRRLAGCAGPPHAGSWGVGSRARGSLRAACREARGPGTRGLVEKPALGIWGSVNWGARKLRARRVGAGKPSSGREGGVLGACTAAPAPSLLCAAAAQSPSPEPGAADIHPPDNRGVTFALRFHRPLPPQVFLD